MPLINSNLKLPFLLMLQHYSFGSPLFPFYGPYITQCKHLLTYILGVLFILLSTSYPLTTLFTPFISTTAYMLRTPGAYAKDSEVYISSPSLPSGLCLLISYVLDNSSISFCWKCNWSHNLFLYQHTLFPLLIIPSFQPSCLKVFPALTSTSSLSKVL